METFKLTDEYIELCNLLKVAGPRISGGEAKHIVTSGLVYVNGEKELRKKCKIRSKQTVTFANFTIHVE